MKYLPFKPMWILYFSLLPLIPFTLYFCFSEEIKVEDIYLNIATELLGIWISTIIIGIMFNYYEASKWKPIENKIHKELNFIFNLHIYEIFVTLDLNKKLQINEMDLFKEPDIFINTFTNYLKYDISENDISLEFKEHEINGIIKYCSEAQNHLDKILKRFNLRISNNANILNMIDDLYINLSGLNYFADVYNRKYLNEENNLQFSQKEIFAIMLRTNLIDVFKASSNISEILSKN